MSVLRKTALLILAMVLVAPAAPASAATVLPPQLDPFYAAPSPMPAGSPGSIIRSRPVLAQALPLLPVPVRATQVIYKSTLVNGQDVAVSGIVLEPLTAWSGGARPIVSYTTGTAGIAPFCATSYQLANGVEYETAIFSLALLKGWAVAITDFVGRGVGPGPQHYIVGPEAGRAAIDMARAAQRLGGTSMSTSSKVGFWGYSEGGHAAAWASELAGTYGSGLAVVGAAAGGVPGDINGVARNLDGSPFSGIMILAAIGADTSYDVPFEEILNDTGRAAVALAKNSCVELTSGFLPFRRMRDFVNGPDPLTLPSWQAALSSMSTGHYKPANPILMYHGTWDELIPFSNARALKDKYCSMGAHVTWKPMYFVAHIGGVPIGAPSAVSWLDDRFRGRSVSNSC
ncbi:lipase family protein [Catelliglobosispora koreensis]|uniref:lipase family protein n=1 Tax=Catelliglobosispora koreensis TaxID=129052 RepID=UPI000375B160|nr:lipase family protein [Catelliglobosispora koreensis]